MVYDAVSTHHGLSTNVIHYEVHREHWNIHYEVIENIRFFARLIVNMNRNVFSSCSATIGIIYIQIWNLENLPSILFCVVLFSIILQHGPSFTILNMHLKD